MLGNPAGLWALLAAPLIVLLHLLRQRPRPLEVSTLFLLDALRPEGRGGRVIQRLRNTAPLWLQLFAVALTTVLLAEPRFLVESSAQRVVLVLDSSASMSVFRDAALARLGPRLAAIERSAAHTEWIALDSDIDRGQLYGGSQRRALLEALQTAWRPLGATHDAEPALRLAAGLAGATGLALFVTDHVREVPAGVALLSAGEPRDNVGFAGVVIDADGAGGFAARVRSYADTAQSRAFWLEVDGERGTERRIDLAPGTAQLVRGVLPEAGRSFVLRLAPDAFPLDDTAPLLRPERKRLGVFVAPELRDRDLLERLIGALGDLDVVAERAGADLAIEAASVSALPAADLSAIVFVSGARAAAESRDLVAVPDSLADGLTWDALLCRHAERPELAPDERVVLWGGRLPLISLRESGDVQQLLVNFDLRSCNAGRLPAFVVALARFVEAVRERTVGYEARNVEVGQLLRTATRAGAGDTWLRTSSTGAARALAGHPLLELRAPDEPDFFEVTQDDQVLLRAAARFAEVREADLRGAGAIDPPEDRTRERALRNSRGDPFRPLWIGLLLAALLASWWLLGRART